MQLSEKNVVYFGGCGGIGSETCKQLVQKNVANLAVLDLVENTDLIEELGKLNTTVFFLKVDIRCNESIKNCVKEVILRVGHIDIFVNGIGIFNEIDANLLISVNLLGLVNSSMAALELMDQSKGNRGGLVLNIASIAGLDPFMNSPIYCASKAGIIMFTRSIAEKFEQTGVSFITICPGVTKTSLLDQCISEELSPDAKLTAHIFNNVKNQAPNDLAINIIQAMEINKNGAVYLCDVGESIEVSFPKYWNPQKN